MLFVSASVADTGTEMRRLWRLSAPMPTVEKCATWVYWQISQLARQFFCVFRKCSGVVLCESCTVNVALFTLLVGNFSEIFTILLSLIHLKFTAGMDHGDTEEALAERHRQEKKDLIGKTRFVLLFMFLSLKIYHFFSKSHQITT